jgi:hypothetical protein
LHGAAFALLDRGYNDLVRSPRYQVVGLVLIALVILAYTLLRFGKSIPWGFR